MTSVLERDVAAVDVTSRPYVLLAIAAGGAAVCAYFYLAYRQPSADPHLAAGALNFPPETDPHRATQLALADIRKGSVATVGQLVHYLRGASNVTFIGQKRSNGYRTRVSFSYLHFVQESYLPATRADAATVERALFQQLSAGDLQLRLLEKERATAFDNDALAHVSLLKQLWLAAGKSSTAFERTGPHWEAFGFQGEDPATDLRGGGVLALRQLVHFAQSHTGAFRDMLAFNQRVQKEKRDCWYLLAVVSIQLTAQLMLQSDHQLSTAHLEVLYDTVKQPINATGTSHKVMLRRAVAERHGLSLERTGDPDVIEFWSKQASDAEAGVFLLHHALLLHFKTCWERDEPHVMEYNTYMASKVFPTFFSPKWKMPEALVGAIMTALNVDAQEWRPTGTVMTDLELPRSTIDDVQVDDEHTPAATNGGACESALEANPTPMMSYFPTGHHEEGDDPPSYYPSFMKDAGELGDIDWDAEFKRVMTLTKSMIEQQLHGGLEGGEVHGINPGADSPGQRHAGEGVSKSAQAQPHKTPPTSGGADLPSDSIGGGGGRSAWVNAVTGDDSNLPPLTTLGNRRWRKPTRAQKRRDQAQKGAFEAFANALLHSVSPFMAPLRAKCKTSLPHIKVDQRFGKGGQPQTAVAQFVVAPLVTNYRPRHFHDVTPGDLLEYHYDFAQVLKQLRSSYCIIIGYGPIWKRYGVPYCYVGCTNYQKEVLALCPAEVPNTRSEAMYGDDIIKDITEVILSVEELQPLQSMSLLQAMSRRVNLAAMYDAFDTIFAPLENYQVEIRNFDTTNTTFHLKTSKLELDQKPQPIVLYNDPTLWDELPVVSRVVVQVTPEGEGETATGATAQQDTDRHRRGGHEKDSAGGVRRADRKKGADADASPTVAAPVPVARHDTWLATIPLAASAVCVLATLAVVWRKRKA